MKGGTENKIQALCEALSIHCQEGDGKGPWKLESLARHQVPGHVFDHRGKQGDVLTKNFTDDVWKRYFKFRTHVSTGLLLACGATAENFRGWKPRADPTADGERDTCQTPIRV